MTDAKYIPLTFVTSDTEKERLIRNTMLLRHFGLEANEEVALAHYIEGTQYGFNAPAKEAGTNRFVRISDISNGRLIGTRCRIVSATILMDTCFVVTISL